MADQDGLDACKAAYQNGIAHFNEVLITNLAAAKTEAERQAAIEAFKRGVALCRDARKICEDTVRS